MARLIARPVRPEEMPRHRSVRIGDLAEARINKGMITTIDPADLENGALQYAKNAVVRFDRTSRRNGTTLFTPAKPNADPVLRIAYIKQQDGIAYTIRMTPNGLHRLGVSSWQLLAGSLIGNELDRFQTAVVLNRLVFANNGANKVQLVDLAANTFAPLGNAPNYRYITGIYNRVVGFARRDQNEVEVGWSADGNILEWDPAKDETAGSSPLVDSPADLSDFGTGIFSGPNVLILLRERSIWLGNKTPIPQNPFYFATAVPNLGCDTPFSALWMGDGLAWLDRKTATVYAFSPGSAPEAIGTPIENSLLNTIVDPKEIFAGYDATNAEYTIFLPQDDGYVIGYTFNRKTRAWTIQDYYGITAADDTSLSTGGIAIDELVGTMDAQVGTMDGLSPPSIITEARIFGRNDGELLQDNSDVVVDAADEVNTTGRDYEMILVSKLFMLNEDQFINRLVIDYRSADAGPIIVQYSLNGGATEASWVTWVTETPTVLNEPQKIIAKQLLRSTYFAFRIKATNCKVDILGYKLNIAVAGPTVQ